METINRATNSAREMLLKLKHAVIDPDQTMEPTRRSCNYNLLLTLRHRHGTFNSLIQ
jgi:hypothetical protein